MPEISENAYKLAKVGDGAGKMCSYIRLKPKTTNMCHPSYRGVSTFIFYIIYIYIYLYIYIYISIYIVIFIYNYI